ncbi:DLG1 protein, partial [Pseudoatta argentina]
MCRAGSRSLDDLDPASMKHPSRSAGLEVAMALFGMVWLLRVRSEMRRCSKCRHEEMLAQQQQQHQQQMQLQQQQQQHHHHHHQHHQQQRTLSQATSLLQTMSDDGVSSSANTLFTLDTPGAAGPAGSYCEVHGYVQAKEDIQEFYELTLLDESKSVQQKTAETIRIADKWEASDGPITPTFAQNDVSTTYGRFFVFESQTASVCGTIPYHFRRLHWEVDERANVGGGLPINHLLTNCLTGRFARNIESAELYCMFLPAVSSSVERRLPPCGLRKKDPAGSTKAAEAQKPRKRRITVFIRGSRRWS